MSGVNDPPSGKQSSPRDDDGPPPSRRGPMIALGVVLLLIVAGILLTNVLHRVTNIQDCVMAGRRNCAPVQSSGG